MGGEGPYGGYRPGAESVAEGQGRPAGIEHDPGYELVADSPGQPLDAAEVFRADGFCGFHLAGDDVAGCCFEDGVSVATSPARVLLPVCLAPLITTLVSASALATARRACRGKSAPAACMCWTLPHEW